jgi:uncharacterized protein YerC
MSHVSKQKLGEGVMEKLFDQLFKTIEKASDKKAIKYVVSELFTRTEKIMLAKRLTSILLLDKGIPQHVISTQLHMSPSTIAKTALKIEKEKYRAIRNTSGVWRGDFLDAIEHFLLMGMPPRTGRGRWGKWHR